jgi:LCP family protein required for cell wall assembly
MMQRIRKNPLIYGVIFLVSFTICVGVGYLMYSWYQPLGEPLSLSTVTASPEFASLKPSETPFQPGPTLTSIPDATFTPVFTPTPTITNTPVYTPTPEPVCGAPDTMNILMVGVAAQYSLEGLADAVRVVHIDFRTQEVTVLPLPRDLWVDIPITIPGVTQGVTPGKLNQAYYYGTDRFSYFQGSGKGAGLLAETIYSDFGLRMDHYTVVNLNSFRTIIDQVGGIDVCFSENIYRKRFEQPVLYLPAGCHHLNGKQAEVVARQRINIGDLGRIQHQTILLKALASKLLSPSGIAQLPDIVNQLKSYVVLDLSPAQISQILCLARMMDVQEDIQFASVPNDMLTLTSRYDPVRGVWTSVLVTDRARMRNLLADFQAGIWP